MNSNNAGIIAGKILRQNNGNNSYDNFITLFKEVCGDEDKLLEMLFEKNNVDLDEKINQFSFALDESTIDIEFLPKAHRKERTILHNKMRDLIGEAGFKLLSGNKNIYEHKYSKTDPRDFPGLFGERIKHPEGSPNGFEVANILSNPDVAVDEKNKKFSKYIDELIDEFEKVNVFSSDEDLVKNYVAIKQIVPAFMLDNISTCFKSLSGCEISPETKAKYNEYRDITQQVNQILDARASTIADPSYCYMDEENAAKLGKKVIDNLAIQDFKPFQRNDIGVKNNIISIVYTNKNTKENSIVSDKFFDYAERRGIIKKDSTLVGENGLIDRNTANGIYKNHGYVGVIDKESGKMKAVSINKNFNIVSIDIADNYNKKAAYKKMLDELNKGTSIINKSSEEYKNMRSILSNLSEGKGNENELLTSLKENSNNYLKNYYKKERLSNIAKKRRQCVLNMLNQLEVSEIESTLGNSMRECKTKSNKIVGEVQKRQAIINDNTKNSSGSFIVKGSGENVKQFVSENDMTNEQKSK